MRIVIKIGTNLVTEKTGILNNEYICQICEQLTSLKKSGHQVILITSGAIAAGMNKLGWKTRPKSLRENQVAASVGQPLLMEVYEQSLGKQKVTTAQILLTRDDFTNRIRYLNMRNTICGLLELGIIPIINENDTVSVEEIQFGDNDTLSALVATKVEAELLIILTDVDGLYTDDPQKNKNAEFIGEVKEIDDKIEQIARRSIGSFVGTGGMYTKVQSAKIVTAAGTGMIIANGYKKNVLIEIGENRQVGTRFVPKGKIVESRKRWIAFGQKTKGKIIVDEGAEEALLKKGKSLLPSGIVSVEGNFSVGETISILNKGNRELARGLTYYSREEINKIKGKKTSQIKNLLDRCDFEEVVHRDNLVLLK